MHGSSPEGVERRSGRSFLQNIEILMEMVKGTIRITVLGMFIMLLWGCERNLVSEEEIQKQRLELEREIRSWSTDTLLCAYSESQSEGNDLKTAVMGEILGNRLRSTSNFVDAINAHRIGLYAVYRMNDTIEIAQALNNLGTDYRRLSALDEGSKYHYDALTILELYTGENESGKNRGIMAALNGIGNICLSMNDLVRAEDCFRKAIALELNDGRPLGLAINYANLGSVFEKRDELDSAFVYYDKSLAQNLLAGSDLGVTLCHIHFGELYEKQNDYGNARSEYEEAYRDMENSEDKWHWLDACIAVARIYILEDEFAKASSYLAKANDVAVEINSFEHIAQIHKHYYLYYEKMGNYLKALEEYKIFQKYQGEILSERHLSHLSSDQVNYEVRKSSKKIDELEEENNKLLVRVQRWLLVSGFLILAFVLVLFVYQSIVLRRTRKLKNVLQIETVKAKESERMKNAFINSMCHEIRTPLNAISGFSELLFDEEVDVEIRKTFQHEIEVNTDLLTSLLTDMLEVAMLDSLQTDVEKKDVDVVSCCRSEIEKMEHLPERNPEVEYLLDLDPQVSILYTNHHYFELVIHSLLSNAAKFTAKGSIELSGYKEGNNKVRFSVTDTGCGVPAEKSEEIFERFVKLDKFRPGTGLGLYICKLAVAKLGGEIWLDTSYTGGAKFTLILTSINPPFFPEK